ncbi:MAG: 4a-hydroxytetrahydrobiopterin dehydratase [Thermoleophilaceae bacterium]|nr:4a-hydroxytetrahydrobiopterin dehydratase [Thermoleophilaceae bacterium]
MALLAEEEVRRRLAELGGWELKGDSIERTFKLADFDESIAFVNRIAEAANEMNHHPDLAISWNTVRATLSTHSQGGLTENDFELARRIDALA